MRQMFRNRKTWWMVSLLSVASLGHAAASDDTRLVEAAKNRDRVAVRSMLTRMADVNVRQNDGATALHWAAHWDDLETAELLIRAGADVNAANDYGVTPLSLACTNGSAVMVSQLVRVGADLNVALPTGETALMTAARTGNVDVVTILLHGGADPNSKERTRGQTALMWATAEGHAEVMRMLIEWGADVHARSTAGFTPLLFAARLPELDQTRILRGAGANVNEAASDGTTALLVATIKGHTALVRFLLDRGADPNARAGFAPLHWAAGAWGEVLAEDSEWGALGGLRGPAKLELVKLLLAHGADPNARAESSPRSYAPGSGFRGSLVGATPFLMAATGAEVEVMRLLVSAGADPLLAMVDKTTSDKTTALMLAAGVGVRGVTIVPESKALQAVKFCIELGVDVNAANAAGDTALHGATYRAAEGANTIVQFLVDKGAQVNVKNQRGWSPLAVAEGIFYAGSNTRAPSTAELLRRLGAEPSPPDLERNASVVAP